MRLKIISIILSAIIFPFLLALVAFGLLFLNIMFGSPLGKIESETSSIPAFVEYGELHLQDDTINIFYLCEQQKENYYLGEIFCVQGNYVYCVCSHSVQTVRTWSVVMIDLTDETFSICCQFTGAQEYYRARPHDAYNKRNGFFYNGKIVLNDFHTVLTYEIETGEVNSQSFATYEFPERTVYSEYLEDQTFALHIDEDVHRFTLQKMAEHSDGIAAIYALNNKKNWDDRPYLSGFLKQDSVQIIADEIYIIDSVVNYWGSPTCVILKYNRETDTWQFVTQFVVPDNIYNHCYIVEQQP